MPLLNYTTTIASDRTVGEIQQALARHGAREILATYETGLIVALAFSIECAGQLLQFRLPADYRPVLVLLQKDRNVPKRLKCKEQALRVTWRILKDWVEAQLALITVQMVRMEQVFLPYMIGPNGQTVYEYMHARRFLAGPAEGGSHA